MKNLKRSDCVPDDPLHFWTWIHASPTNGFFLESDVIFMSAGEPSRVLRAPASGVSNLLKKIKTSFRRGASAPRFVGFLGFEAGRAFDPGIERLPRPSASLGTPDVLFGDYPAVIKIDLKKKETTLFSRGSAAQARRILARMDAYEGPALARESRPPARRKKFKFAARRRFSRMVAQAREAIARGDIYQANLSLRFERKFSGSPVALFRRLSEKNPSPYACLLKMGPDWIVSCSPELLLNARGRRVVTRPIAGTRPRGRTPEVDRKRQGQLLLSPKERAEHVMLVDLERNDLGRVCSPGSVHVSERCAVERYSHVMHIVSQVEGRLAPGKDSIDALQAVFPGGTITGCPKIKSMEIIAKIEKAARGPFYGSLGFWEDNGDATFNILIRTALIRRKKIFFQAGAGIVADSHPAREYKEVLAKAGALLDAAGRFA